MIINMTAADINKWVSYGPCEVKRFHGWNNTGANIYIQFFQAPTAANAAVPAIKSFVATANNGFDYELEGIPLTELYVALSTTEVNLTAVAAAGGLDWTLDVNTNYPVDANTVLVGDLTTAVANKAVWAEAAGGVKQLLRLDVVESSGITCFFGISPFDSIIKLSPILFVKLAANATVTKFFNGLQPLGISGGVVSQACQVNHYSANADGTLLLPAVIGIGVTIAVRAIYNNR